MIRSVLVVEDDAQIRNGMIALLRIAGHSGTAAASVTEAASQLDAATPTHLLLDLNLPDGAGTDILRRIRKEGLAIRVALLTGAIDNTLLSEARDLGVDAIFIKPPDWDKLLDWIAQPESPPINRATGARCT
jgi:two-component system response regulator TctD